MRVNRGVLGWGVFLIVLGAVPLAVRQGIVSAEAASQAWTLWPILLIVGGLALVLRRTPIDPVAGLAAAAVFGLIAGGVVATGTLPFSSCGDERGSVAFPTRSGDLGQAATFDVDLGCGDLTVATRAGTTWSVEGMDSDGDGPDIDTADNRLRVRSDEGGWGGPFETRERWMVVIPSDSRIDLDAAVNAGVGRFDLAGARLGTVRIRVNAGETTIDLAHVSDIEELDVELNAVGGSRIVLPGHALTGRISANAAGGIRLCAPTGVGLRLTVNDNVTASNNYAARGLVRRGDSYETPAYASAPIQIDLRTEVNAGGFELEPEGSCDG